MTEVLTAELVLSKTKVDNLHSVCNLNLWGNELQVILTDKLRI